MSFYQPSLYNRKKIKVEKNRKLKLQKSKHWKWKKILIFLISFSQMFRNESVVSVDLIKHYIGESLEQWLLEVFKTFYYIEGENLIECPGLSQAAKGEFWAVQLTLSQPGEHIMPTTLVHVPWIFRPHDGHTVMKPNVFLYIFFGHHFRDLPISTFKIATILTWNGIILTFTVGQIKWSTLDLGFGCVQAIKHILLMHLFLAKYFIKWVLSRNKIEGTYSDPKSCNG